jgi:hypothetical protein
VTESGGARGFGKDAPVTSDDDHALRTIGGTLRGGDDGPHAFGGGAIGGGLHTDVGSSTLVVSGCLITSGRSICETDGGSDVSSGGGNAAVPKGAGGVLAAGDGDGMLRTGIGSDTPSDSGGLDARVLDGDLVAGGALCAVYCSTCGLGGGLGGCTGDLNGGRPDDSEGGLIVLVSGGLRAMGGGATLLVAQCGKRLGTDTGGLRGFGSCCLVASYSL